MVRVVDAQIETNALAADEPLPVALPVGRRLMFRNCRTDYG